MISWNLRRVVTIRGIEIVHRHRLFHSLNTYLPRIYLCDRASISLNEKHFKVPVGLIQFTLGMMEPSGEQIDRLTSNFSPMVFSDSSSESSFSSSLGLTTSSGKTSSSETERGRRKGPESLEGS